MDKNSSPTVKNISDNANAPGTFPTPVPTPSIDKIIANTSAIETTGNNPKAPYSADPLNGGVPTSAASIEPTTALELELGGTGTILVHGILAEADYNPDLAGTKRIEIYDQMRRGDATVRLGLAAIKYPILSASWYIKQGENEDEKGEKKTFIEQELFQNPNFSWDQLLRQTLLFCDYGNSFAEKVFRRRADGKIGWKRFAPRLPKTVWRYTLQDGITPGITQILPTGGIAEIPQWKLLMCVLDMEGSNYEGVSFLRSAYQPWFYKTLYYKIDSIATERQGMGVPIIHVPAQATDQDKATAKVIAQNMRVNEQSYVNLPPGFRIEYIDTKAKELKEVKEMVMHHDRQILKSFAAQFLDLGSVKAGSQGVSDNQYEFFLSTEDAIAKIVKEQFDIAIRELVDLNFSNVKAGDYPTLAYGTIGQVDFDKLGTALKNLSDAGVIVPDADLERHVRKAMSLPDAIEPDSMDEEDLKRRKVIEPPPPTPVIAGGIAGKKPLQKVVNNEAMAFMESIMELKENLESIIDTENGY